MNGNTQYTLRTTEALQSSFKAAAGRGNPETTPTHLLLELVNQDEGVAGKLLAKAGVATSQLTNELRAALDRLPSADGVNGSISETRPGASRSMSGAGNTAWESSAGDFFARVGRHSTTAPIASRACRISPAVLAGTACFTIRGRL